MLTEETSSMKTTSAGIQVQKREGNLEEFDMQRIVVAIVKAMKDNTRKEKAEIREDIAKEIAEEIMESCKQDKKAVVTIKEIEKEVYDRLNAKGQAEVARVYTEYKAIREYQRTTNTIDSDVYGIIDGSNKDAINENSNKDALISATQRDLIAGEFSRDYSLRMKLPTRIAQGHKSGIFHDHDLDYYAQDMFNCGLVDLKGMYEKGTVINKKLIETPKSFQTACTVATQIVQQVANGQYGGQTISIAHIAPFLRVSKEKWRNKIIKDGIEFGVEYTEEQIDAITKVRLQEELEAGVQTIQFQINTFSTTNGQAPFLTIFMYLDEEPEYKEETAMIVEEILKQRYKGMKNEAGAYITPSFPKLVYVLDEDNIHTYSKYKYITDLAVKTVAKRMMPDFISAKIMKECYDGEVFPPMGCRSFLAPWKDPETGKYKWYGRFNQGVVTLNLIDVALTAGGNIDMFWDILKERLQLCKEALMLKHEKLKGVVSDVSPIHWQYGAIARLGKHEKIDKYLENGYSTISLGYCGLYETVKVLTGKSHTDPDGCKVAEQIMDKLEMVCAEWKEETGIGFGLYGTPNESTTYKFAKCLRNRFGVIKDITDKDYVINSYHVDIKEKIDAFSKLAFEAKFQNKSSGGAISYVEVPNMEKNLDALYEIIKFIYYNIRYAEINTKSDYCQKCGFSGEILLDEELEWYCPNCGNRDRATLNVCRRTCGYLGDNFWNKGRTEDIKNRELHLDNKEYKLINVQKQPLKVQVS